MNWLDIVIIVTLVINIIAGLWVGLIKAVLSLVGLVVGVVLAGRFYLSLSEQLSFIPGDTAARVVAFIIILVVVLAVAFLLAWLLSKAASAIMLGWANRLGGAIFGVLMGILIWSALLAAWVEFFGAADTISQSFMARILLDYFPLGPWLLPGDFDSAGALF